MSDVKLISMEKEEWRGIGNGEHWRTDKVYKCQVCGCLSNEFFMFAPSYAHPKLVCPGYDYNKDLHNELQEKVLNSQERKHPRTHADSLRQEIDLLRVKFNNVKPHIVGLTTYQKVEHHNWS